MSRWEKPTIKIWSSYLWPLTLKWQVWFSRWPPRGENIGQIVKLKKTSGGIAQRYHHTKFQPYSPSGYETCSANGRLTPYHGNSSPDPDELKIRPTFHWILGLKAGYVKCLEILVCVNVSITVTSDYNSTNHTSPLYCTVCIGSWVRIPAWYLSTIP
jgi:hypothetical protein